MPPRLHRRRPVLALAVFAAIGLSMPAGSAYADFPAGLKAYDAGDFATAAREWTAAANAGDQAAMRNLGHLYRWGRGVPADAMQAVLWYRKAADLGFDRAMVNLGMLYLDGAPGVPRNAEEGRFWLRKAAELNNQDAKDALSDLDSGRIPLLTRVAPPKTPERPKAAAVVNSAGENALAAPPPPQPQPVEEVGPARPAPPDRKPSRALAPSAGETTVLAHLGIFGSEEEASHHWNRLAATVPDLSALAPYYLHGFIPGSGPGTGPIVRLYARGSQSALMTLCRSVPADQTCELHQAFH